MANVQTAMLSPFAWTAQRYRFLSMKVVKEVSMGFRLVQMESSGPAFSSASIKIFIEKFESQLLLHYAVAYDQSSMMYFHKFSAILDLAI